MTQMPHVPLLSCELADEAATVRFAQDIASAVLPRDVIALEGDLGAGKTAFSRALIRTLANDPDLEVPSPTFSLMQPYAVRIPVRHFDLYRMGNPEELDELGFFDDLDEALTLIEWPARASHELPQDRIILQLDILAGERRQARLFVNDAQHERFRRAIAARQFLETVQYTNAERSHVQGDASHRAYERVESVGKPSAILMNAPETPAGEIIADGKSYADLVHRATDTKPFEAVGKLLLATGLSAPNIYAADHIDGFMLLEDLGGIGLLDKAGLPDKERYITAIDTLAHLHDSAGEMSQSITGVGGDYNVPKLDRTAFLTEVSLFAEWFVGNKKYTLNNDAKKSYLDIWSQLFDQLEHAETGIILRDVHSPNLLWLEERQGISRIGVLDFQDALWGPQAYDLASLVFDARVTIGTELREELIERYRQKRRRNLEDVRLNEHISILAAQRTAKILGIFARLANRDAKLSYLTHMPRNEAYLGALLENSVLAPLAHWHEVHLPQS
ncbi:MAG: tRNA (adenosine(37)-N6)-threonylcarbamoyltransferase complex ATPase subunit type 1 TsaE [Hyphomicrobiales bacterium]